MRSPVSAEPSLKRLQHHIADVRSTDARVHHRSPGDDLPIVGIDDERAPDDVAVPAGELDPVRAPSDIRAHRTHLTLMGQLRALGISAGEQEVMRLRDAVDALVVHGCDATCPKLAVQDRGDPAVATSRAR